MSRIFSPSNMIPNISLLILGRIFASRRNRKLSISITSLLENLATGNFYSDTLVTTYILYPGKIASNIALTEQSLSNIISIRAL
jgi:hypothetical protein